MAPFPDDDRPWSTASMDVDDAPIDDGGGRKKDGGAKLPGQKPRNGSRKGRKGPGSRAPWARAAGRNQNNPSPVRPADAIGGEAARARQLSRVDELEDRLDRLGLICEAMWDLLSTEIGLDLGRLAARVEEMAKNGSPEHDHRGPDVSSCPECGEAMPLGAKTCLFCAARSTDDEDWPKVGGG